MSTVRTNEGSRVATLDGIRTIAVALVILFHVKAPFFAAGYIGVDVFFVLSGFLITSGLIREWNRSGGIDLGRFWARRIRRLLPAALLMVGVVLLWSVAATSRYEQAGVGEDAFWTLLYVANWHFIGTASYFASDGSTSVLEHMWSLAVEEQFYLLWPLLFAAAGAVALVLRRRVAGSGRRAPGLLVVVGLVGVVVASVSVVLLATLYDPESPERAYMGTDSKAFEPMIGALLAVILANPSARAAARRHASILMVAGAALMVALFAVLDGPAPLYFRGGSLVFALATAALIAGAASTTGRLAVAALGNAPMAYVGQISYAMYLWHWPWAVWLGAYSEFSVGRALAVVVLTTLCSVASYHLVELPVREGRIAARLTERRTFAVAVVLVPAALVGQTPATPVVTALANTVAPGTLSDGAAERTVVLVGDSVPSRLMPVLAPAAEERSVTVVSAVAGGCSPLAVHQRVSATDEAGETCPEVEETQRETIRAHDPDVVLWWSRYEIADRVGEDGSLLEPTDPQFWPAQRERFMEAVNRLTGDGATLYVVETERPGVGMLSRCTEEECHPFLERMVTQDHLRQQWNDLVRQVAHADERVRVITVSDLFCPDPQPDPDPARFGSGLCDDRDDTGRIARPDGSHFDVELVGDEISQALLDELS